MRSAGKRRGGEKKLNTRRIIQSAFIDSIELGNKRGGKRKDSKGKKMTCKVFNGIRFVIREIDSRIMELQTKKKKNI